MNMDKISPVSNKHEKYPNIPNYQPDIELKRDINMQFMSPEYISKYNADVIILFISEFY